MLDLLLRPSARVLSLSLSALSIGCSSIDLDSVGGCRSNSECAIGQSCNVFGNTCVPEPASGFRGRFTCDVVLQEDIAAGNDATLPGSDVLGQIDGHRHVLPLGAICSVSGKHDLLRIVTSSFDGATTLWVYLGANETAGGGAFALRRAELRIDQQTASLTSDFGTRYLAFSSQGTIVLEQPPVVGTRISGHVDVAMHRSVGGPIRYGIPCPNGLGDCGGETQNDYEVACLQFTVMGDERGTCTWTCQTHADCGAPELACVQGFCTRACNVDQDCDPPLACTLGDAGRNGCF